MDTINTSNSQYINDEEDGQTNANFLQSDFKASEFRNGNPGDQYYNMENNLLKNRKGIIQKEDGSMYVDGDIYDQSVKENDETLEVAVETMDEKEEKLLKNKVKENEREEPRLTNYEKNKILAEKVEAEELSEFNFPSMKTSELNEADNVFLEAGMDNIEVKHIERRSDYKRKISNPANRQSLDLQTRKKINDDDIREDSFRKNNGDLTPLLRKREVDEDFEDDFTVYESVQTEPKDSVFKNSSSNSNSKKSRGLKNRLGSMSKSIRKSGEDEDSDYESCTWQSQTQENGSLVALSGSVFKNKVNEKKKKERDMFQSVKDGGEGKR